MFRGAYHRVKYRFFFNNFNLGTELSIYLKWQAFAHKLEITRPVSPESTLILSVNKGQISSQAYIHNHENISWLVDWNLIWNFHRPRFKLVMT